MRLALLFVTSAVSILSACAHSYRERLDQNLSTWLQKHPDRLIEAWGAPLSSYTMENGRKALTFEETTYISRSMGSFYYYPRPDVYSYSDRCRITFFTDSTQKVLESFSYTGSPSLCYELIDSQLARHVSPPPTQP